MAYGQRITDAELDIMRILWKEGSLERMLNGDGLVFCREIRNKSPAHIIVLTVKAGDTGYSGVIGAFRGCHEATKKFL